jgi:hypothetical protein
MPETLRIDRNRKLFAFATVLFGALAGGGLARESSAGSVAGVIAMLLVFGLPCLFFAQGLLRRRPVLEIDGEGLNDLRSGRVVRWTTTNAIALRRRQGPFGEYHHLVFTDAFGEVSDISIDQLALSWKDIVSTVEKRAGKSVGT